MSLEFGGSVRPLHYCCGPSGARIARLTEHTGFAAPNYPIECSLPLPSQSTLWHHPEWIGANYSELEYDLEVRPAGLWCQLSRGCCQVVPLLLFMPASAALSDHRGLLQSRSCGYLKRAFAPWFKQT